MYGCIRPTLSTIILCPKSCPCSMHSIHCRTPPPLYECLSSVWWLASSDIERALCRAYSTNPVSVSLSQALISLYFTKSSYERIRVQFYEGESAMSSRAVSTLVNKMTTFCSLDPRPRVSPHNQRRLHLPLTFI